MRAGSSSGLTMITIENYLSIGESHCLCTANSGGAQFIGDRRRDVLISVTFGFMARML
jgi:hypothetical protein